MIYCIWIELLFVYGHHSKKGACQFVQKRSSICGWSYWSIHAFPTIKRKKTTTTTHCSGKLFGVDLLFDIQKFVTISILPNAS